MLEKASQRRFFDRVEASSDEELDLMIEKTQQLAKTFAKGSEAEADAKFMKRHMLRIRAERHFNNPKATVH